VQGFDEGVRFENMTSSVVRGVRASGNAIGVVVAGGRRNAVIATTARNNQLAGISVSGRFSLVARSDASDNGRGGIGILVDQNGHSSAVVGNTADSDHFIGILVNRADRTLVAGNVVSRAGHGIVVVGSRNRVARNHVIGGCGSLCDMGISVWGGTGNGIVRNLVEDPGRDGIRVGSLQQNIDPDVVGTTVRANRVRRAGRDAIGVTTEDPGQAIRGTVIARNDVRGSGDDGIDVRHKQTTITGNRANRNADLGIDGVPGVSDGGGNRARANGNPAQCRNVRCR
jgi:parallel beta-helix repeat protein